MKLPWLILSLAAAWLLPGALAQEEGATGAPTDTSAEAATSSELLANPYFSDNAKGWDLKQAETSELMFAADRPILRLMGVNPAQGGYSTAGTRIEPAPTNRRLDFFCRALGTNPDQELVINAFGYRGKAELTAKFSQKLLLPTPGKWTIKEISYLLPEGTERMVLWLVNPSGRDIYVGETHLTQGEATHVKMQMLDGPGVILAFASLAVRAEEEGASGVVTFAVPAARADQVPLTYDLTCVPPEALESFTWRLREDGVNRVCEAKIKPPAGGAALRWESLVLVGRSEEPKELPDADHSEAPEECAPWLKASACVQSDDPSIRKKAEELAKESGEDVKAYARAVIKFCATNHGSGSELGNQDALSALESGGTPAGRANLAAALLRARGIPARLLSDLPTWMAPGLAHWLVEYWHPGLGWNAADPSLDRIRTPSWSRVILQVIQPKDEAKASDANLIERTGVPAGTPGLSVFAVSPPLKRDPELEAPLLKIAGNKAVGSVGIEGNPDQIEALFAAAEKNFARLCEASQAGRIDRDRMSRIMAALQTGDAENIQKTLSEPEEKATE